MPWLPGRQGKTKMLRCTAKVRTVSRKGVIKYKTCGRKFASPGLLEQHYNRAHNK